jgi:hypothetical protein
MVESRMIKSHLHFFRLIVSLWLAVEDFADVLLLRLLINAVQEIHGTRSERQRELTCKSDGLLCHMK